MRNISWLLRIGIVQCCLWTVNLAVGQTALTPHPGNPVLSYGGGGSWDAGVLYLPDVIIVDDLFYMFYSASADLRTMPIAIGYATSADGLNWTKYATGPVFSADESGFDAHFVAEGRVILQGATWVLYYNGREDPGPGPGAAIGRATASSPAGPWRRSPSPVLTAGLSGEWDSGFITPNSIIATDSGFVMYYSGGSAYPFPPSGHAMVGMATSADGISWTKYDDPATTNGPYAGSDPVLALGSPGSYDSGLAWEADVLKTDDGWEMFYTSDSDDWSGETLSYATSADGIRWAKHQDNPILMRTQNWATLDVAAPSVVKVDGKYLVYYVGNRGLFDGQIGLATAVDPNPGPAPVAVPTQALGLKPTNGGH